MTTRHPGHQRLGHGGWRFWLVLALMTLAQPALAETYAALDCPGSIFTMARSINDRGDIVGICEDANAVRHGFLLRKGVYTLIDAPNATDHTIATGINNQGDVVGLTLQEEVGHGYLLRNGLFTFIDVPGSPNTFPLGIDNLGRIVGWYEGSDAVIRGFILDWRGFRDLEFPDAQITGAWGVNALTGIVGGYIDMNDGPHGFLRKKGVFSSIDFPGAVGTRAFGINILGHIVGGWSGDPECPDCFENAFLLTRRGFTSLAFPNALETVPWGINSKGQIVGHYIGEDEAFHGFIRQPGAELAETPEASLLIPASPTGGGQLAASKATTNIQNKDGPGEFSFNGFFWEGAANTFKEANRVISVQVYRIRGSMGTVSVGHEITSASASAGSDFLVTPAALTWADGEVGGKSIRVELLEDSVLEGTECFTIQLSRPTGGAGIWRTHDTYRICIEDDELGFGLQNSTATVSEGGDSVTLVVERIGAATGTASVNYATESGLATAGPDFTTANGTLDWADGDSTTRDIVINIANDTLDESNETFTVALSNPSAGMALATAVATVTITDDDVSGGGGGGGGAVGGNRNGGGAFDWLTAFLLGGLYLARRQCGRFERCRSIRSELWAAT